MYIAYVAKDPSNKLLGTTTFKFAEWSSDFVTHHQSPYAPALSRFGGPLHMAYVCQYARHPGDSHQWQVARQHVDRRPDVVR
jgi:hypothetical protein